MELIDNNIERIGVLYQKIKDNNVFQYQAMLDNDNAISDKTFLTSDRIGLDCELNLRLVMLSYYNDKQLTDIQLQTIKNYFIAKELSDEVPPTKLSLFQLSIIHCYCSGEFDEEEYKVLDDIRQYYSNVLSNIASSIDKNKQLVLTP